MREFNLENAWCKTTQENYDALIKLGYKPSNNIAYAFRKEFETHLFIKDNTIKWGHKNCIGTIHNPNYWGEDREIYLVDGIFYYVMQIPKPKNNFQDYGFEADFEGEILSDIEDYYIGYYIEKYPCITEKQKIPTFWNKNTGNCYKGAGVSNSKYSLKPIKKEWYENPDNFPCVMYSNLTHSYFIVDRIEDYILDEKYRLATKEEVLSLLVKE